MQSQGEELLSGAAVQIRSVHDHTVPLHQAGNHRPPLDFSIEQLQGPVIIVKAHHLDDVVEADAYGAGRILVPQPLAEGGLPRAGKTN